MSSFHQTNPFEQDDTVRKPSSIYIWTSVHGCLLLVRILRRCDADGKVVEGWEGSIAVMPLLLCISYDLNLSCTSIL
jgi:hypothetical protein